MGARDEILARVARAKVAPVTPITFTPPLSRPGSVGHFAERVADYRASVTVCTEAELPEVLAGLLRESAWVALPDDAPAQWACGLPPAEDLDAAGVSAVTGCALAIAETGTIVLDTGHRQGRRALTLVPDHHICIVHSGQIVADVPDAVTAVKEPSRPLTFISGPSATSDIELDRVEGVHGPRRLDVVIITSE